MTLSKLNSLTELLALLSTEVLKNLLLKTDFVMEIGFSSLLSSFLLALISLAFCLR